MKALGVSGAAWSTRENLVIIILLLLHTHYFGPLDNELWLLKYFKKKNNVIYSFDNIGFRETNVVSNYLTSFISIFGSFFLLD